MDGAVPQRVGERVVDAAVLVEQREPIQARGRNRHLEVVAAARPVLDAQLLRVGERPAQEGFEAIDGHAAMVRTGPTLSGMEEIGLFPLGIVLLPGERVPLHIFEPRYRELVGECIEQGVEFGLLYADEDGIREIGTRARVAAILERFDDGRLNVVVEGGRRFAVERLTQGRSFMTAVVDELDDEPGPVDEATRGEAVGAFRALAALAGVEPDLDEASPVLSFDLAAQVELAADAKQGLLGSRSEQERLEIVGELLDEARRMLIATRELSDASKKNGSRPH